MEVILMFVAETNTTNNIQTRYNDNGCSQFPDCDCKGAVILSDYSNTNMT
jgi:hypothetical protein